MPHMHTHNKQTTKKNIFITFVAISTASCVPNITPLPLTINTEQNHAFCGKEEGQIQAANSHYLLYQDPYQHHDDTPGE